MARASCAEMRCGPDCLTVAVEHLLPTSPEGHPLPPGSSGVASRRGLASHEPLPRFEPLRACGIGVRRTRRASDTREVVAALCEVLAVRSRLHGGFRWRKDLEAVDADPAGTKLPKSHVESESRRGNEAGTDISSVEQLRCIDRRP